MNGYIKQYTAVVTPSPCAYAGDSWLQDHWFWVIAGGGVLLYLVAIGEFNPGRW